MEIRLSPEAEKILREPGHEVEAWSPQKCLVVAGLARDFKAWMDTENRRGVLERVARHLEHEAAAKQAAAQRP